MVQELSKVDHVTRGNAKFLYAHKDSQDLKAILLSGLEGINELEDQAELMQLLLPLTTATGANLDYWGELFNVPNRPENDEEYRSLIYAFIITYYSNGDARSIRDSLLDGLSCTEVNVYDSTPGRYIAMLYNPNILLNSPEVIDTSLLNTLLSLASAVGVSSSGIVLVPGQFGYLEFEDQVSNAIQITNENFEYWDGWRFNSGLYSSSDDGKRLFTNTSSDTQFNIISDDADFYDDIFATSGTALESLDFRFYSGIIGTLNPRIEFKSEGFGSTNALVIFNFPDSSYADPFFAKLNSVMKTNGGECILRDKNGTKLTVKRISASSSSTSGLTNTLLTSDGVDYQRVQFAISATGLSNYEVSIEDVPLTGSLEEIASLVGELANFNRTDESQFNQYNPNGVTSGQFIITGTGENVYFRDLEDNTWGFGVGSPASNTVLTGEWNQTSLTLNNNIRNDTAQAALTFPTSLASGIRVIGAYTNENGSGVYFNLNNDVDGNAFLTDLTTTQMFTYYSSSGKPVTLFTPGSTIADVASVSTTDDSLTISLRLLDKDGIRVLDAICMGSQLVPDGWANAQDGYTISQLDLFQQNNLNGQLVGMDDSIDLSDLCLVTKNNESSHSFELSTVYDDISNTDQVAFTSANPWGLLKTYYVFTATDAKPIIPGRYAYLGDDGSGGEVLTGEDTGHLSTLYLQPNATNEIDLEAVPNVSSWASISTELAGVTASQKDFGYNVTAGQGDYPDRIVTNTWRENVVKYIDYWKEELSVIEKTQIENINARLDPLDSNLVTYYDPPPPGATFEIFDMSSSTSEGSMDPRDSSYGGANSSKYLAFKGSPDNFEDWRLTEELTGSSQTCLNSSSAMFCSPRIYNKSDGVYYTAERDKDYSDGDMGLDYSLRIEGFNRNTGAIGTNVIDILSYPKDYPAVYVTSGQKDISSLYEIVESLGGGYTARKGPDMICRMGNKLYIVVCFFDHDLQTVSSSIIDSDIGMNQIHSDKVEFWELDMLTLNMTRILSTDEDAVPYTFNGGARKFFQAVGDGLFYSYAKLAIPANFQVGSLYYNLETGESEKTTLFDESTSFTEQITGWSAQPVCATLDGGNKSHSIVANISGVPIDTDAGFVFNGVNNQQLSDRIKHFDGTSSNGGKYAYIRFYFKNQADRDAMELKLRQAFEYGAAGATLAFEDFYNEWEFKCVTPASYNIISPTTYTSTDPSRYSDSYGIGVRIQGAFSDGTETNYFESYKNGFLRSETSTLSGFTDYNQGMSSFYDSRNPDGIRIKYGLNFKMKHLQWGNKFNTISNTWNTFQREYVTSFDQMDAGVSIDYKDLPVCGSGTSFVDTQEDRYRTYAGLQYKVPSLSLNYYWSMILYKTNSEGYLITDPSFHLLRTTNTTLSNNTGGNNFIGIGSFAKPFELDKFLGTKMYFTLRGGAQERSSDMFYLCDVRAFTFQNSAGWMNEVPLISKTGDSLNIPECGTTWSNSTDSVDYCISTESRNLIASYAQKADITNVGYTGYNEFPVMKTGFVVWSDSIITYAFKSANIATLNDINLSSATLSKLFLLPSTPLAKLNNQLMLLENGFANTTLSGLSSKTIAASQGDTYQLSLSGRWDPAVAGTQTFVLYDIANQPQIQATLSKSPMDGRSVNFALNYLYPLISGFDGTRNIPLFDFNFLGGTATHPDFETFVSSFSTDKTHLQENIVMTAGTPVTITHNLGEKLVVLKAYSGGGTHVITKVLVDTNSLTIESATNATVSIIIKA